MRELLTHRTTISLPSIITRALHFSVVALLSDTRTNPLIITRTFNIIISHRSLRLRRNMIMWCLFFLSRFTWVRTNKMWKSRTPRPQLENANFVWCECVFFSRCWCTLNKTFPKVDWSVRRVQSRNCQSTGISARNQFSVLFILDWALLCCGCFPWKHANHGHLSH